MTAAQTAYRPEIDGLRAIAIVPVVLYHANAPGFAGGLLGVDVFFVISGYLITRILAGQLASGSIDLARFYERRARRVLIPLLPMLAATSVAAWAVMTAEDIRHFGRALRAAALFGANLWFALRSDYFAFDEVTLPLLHTWSLAVEEQFYLAYPIALALCWRLAPRALAPLVVAVAGLSLAAMLWLAQRDANLAFFLSPMRAWELMIGAGCALAPAIGRRREWASGIGLALVAAGFVAAPEQSMPGPIMIAPVVGTALLLLATNEHSLAGRLLAWKPLVWVGLISYGTYLWHLPLIGFAHYLWFGSLPGAFMALLVVLSFLLGWLSYLLVERPVRTGRALPSRQWVLAASAAGVAGFALLGTAASSEWIVPRLGGFEQLPGSRFAGEDVDHAVEPPGEAPLPFVIYGDSHARQYFPAMSEALGKGALISSDRCLDLPGLSNRAPSEPDDGCRDQFSRLIEVIDRRKPKTVILAHLWDRHLWDAGGTIAETRPTEGGKAAFTTAVARALAAIPADARIVVIGHVPAARPASAPQMDRGYMRCRAYLNVSCPTHIPRAQGEGVAVNRLLSRAVAGDPRVVFLDPADVLCTRTTCPIIEGGTLIYSDESHVSMPGSRRIAKRVADVIARGAPLS